MGFIPHTALAHGSTPSARIETDLDVCRRNCLPVRRLPPGFSVDLRSLGQDANNGALATPSDS